MCGLWCSEIADPDIDIEIWGRLWNAARVRAASTSPKLVKSIQKWKGRENLARSSSGWIAIFIEFGNFCWDLGFHAFWNESKTINFCLLWSSLEGQSIKKASFLVRSLCDTTTDEPSWISHGIWKFEVVIFGNNVRKYHNLALQNVSLMLTIGFLDASWDPLVPLKCYLMKNRSKIS